MKGTCKKSGKDGRAEPAAFPGKIAAGVVSFVKYFSMVTAGCMAIAVLGLLLQGNPDPAATWQFAQYSVACALHAVIFAQVKCILDDLGAGRAPLVALQARRFEAMGAAFLALGLCGFIFSFIAAFIACGSVPSISFAMPYPCYPTADVWAAVFSGATETQAAASAYIDMGPIAFSFFFWGLAKAFEQRPQSDEMETDEG